MDPAWNRNEAMEERPREMTLLELVQLLQTETHSDSEVVAAVVQLLDSGRVVLIGNFANHRFDVGSAD